MFRLTGHRLVTMSVKNGWEPYKRVDGKLAWRVYRNGNVIGTDGNQGYENEGDMVEAARSVAAEIIAADRAGQMEDLDL